MFDASNLRTFSGMKPGYARQSGENANWFCRAHEHFERAYQRAWLRGIWNKLTRRSNKLLNLNDFSLNIKNRYYAGLRTVSIDAICGTEGRADDFDDAFDPLNDRTRDRWEGIFVACSQSANLPPVELIQVGEIYFVRDGHHRISVAKDLGELAIDAHLMVWDVEGTLPWERPSEACSARGPEAR